MNRTDQEDLQFLSLTAASAREQKLTHFEHLDQPVGILNYIRIANEIADAIPSRGRLLDWGCGAGQMTYLLKRRGFDVTAYEVGGPDARLPDVPLTRDLRVVRSTHPTNLPFPDESFDVVLSCGVLEHVDEFSAPGNERVSLDEIRRVLRPGGYFSIYQLPQRYAWQEAVIRRIGGGYTHPRRYTAPEISRLLDEHGYDIRRLSRNNMLPKNLSGVPSAVRDFYSRFARALIPADRILSTVPAINQLAGVLEILARRR